MSFRKKVKNIVPKVDLQSYMIGIAGGYKSGKTRLWKELIETFYPEQKEAGLLLAFEPGYNTWELDSVIPMHDYDWRFFKGEVVKGLLEEAKSGRVTNVLGIDTADRLMDMATEYILDELNKKYGKKMKTLQEVAETIKGTNGYMLLKQEVWKQIDLLKNAGYGIIWLAWTKEKETTTRDDLKYNSIELKMSKTGADIFESQADLIVTLHNEVTVMDKNGNEIEENLKNKGGKEQAAKYHSTEAYMYFLPSSYIGIGGGRFTDLPEKVPYGVENFLGVFENAVKGQLKKNTKSITELKSEEDQVREEKAKEFVDKVNELSPNEILEEINSLVSDIERDKKLELSEQFKETFGEGNYKQLKTVEELNKALEIVKSFLN
ncbi:AAA family ATPase [Priestia sp. WB3]